MSTLAPVWPGPRLLAPMVCDVLLFGTADHNSSGDWAATQTNYNNLYMGSDPGPLPFNTTSRPAVGAHMMWTLPYALRHGVQDSTTGAVEFPISPNRFLVMRLAYPTDNTPPTLTATVINADMLSSLSADLSQYPDANGNAPKTIGQFQSLDTWSAPLSSDDFLQAIGPGNVSWSAAYDNVKNVFSLYDALPSSAGRYAYIVAGWYANPDSDPTSQLPTDSNDAWQDALESFGWSLGNEPADVLNAIKAWNTFAGLWGVDNGIPDDSLPEQLKSAAQAWIDWRTSNGISADQPDLAKQLLCHSLVATVDWQGDAVSYGSGAPGGGIKYPDIAMGNTSTEAISVYMAKTVVEKYGQLEENIPVIEQAMEAFQLGILNQLADDVVGTEVLLHQARFGNVSGGQEWVVVQSPESGTTSDNTQVVALNKTQTEALSSLNETQAEFDKQNAIAESQRGELGALIFKANQLTRSSPDWLTPEISNDLSVMTDALNATNTTLSSLADQINDKKTALEGDLGSDYDVKSVSDQPFYRPNDPVVLVAGASLDTKWAAPGDYGGDETLRVRVTGQTVSGLTLTYDIDSTPTELTLTADDLMGSGQVSLPTRQGATLAGLPKEIGFLLVEAILLDPNAAPYLATRWFAKAGHTPTAQQTDDLITEINSMQRALWSQPGGLDEQATQSATGFTGVVPAATAVSLRNGQPWTPVFVDWQVRWMPNARSSAPLRDQFNNWALSEIDYQYDTTFDPNVQPLDFVGRSVVNASTALALQAQFATFEDDPDYDNLPAYIRDDMQLVADTIGGIDMVTQSLTGFSEQLTTRLVQMMQPYVDPNAKVPVTQQQIDLVGEGPWSFKPVTGSAPDSQPAPGTEGLPFFPLRSGHLELMKLWVVDSFGQILVGQNPQFEPEPIQMTVSQSMKTEGSDFTHVAQLPPRIVQPSRAALNLIDSNNDQILTNSSMLTTPICGWVMANHLDDSLMVFDTEGNNKGSIIAIEGDNSTTGLRWDQPVGSSAPLGSTPDLENVHLSGFVNSLLATGMVDTKAYGSLLDIIDAAIWAGSSGGDIANTGNLAVMLGKPLALVRARIDFNLMGMPLYNQTWGLTGEYYVDGSNYSPTPAPIQGVDFNFRIGDLGYQTNGVIGYFIADDYNTIYSAHAYTPTSAIRAALKQQPAARQTDAYILESGATPSSDYVGTDHLIQMSPDASPIYVTLLVDPTKEIPFISGSQPSISQGLPPGQYAAALDNMAASFRVGPILTDPNAISMPLPGEIRGKWGWAARTDVTDWTSTDQLTNQNAVATLNDLPPTLSEGWLTLSGAFGESNDSGDN